MKVLMTVKAVLHEMEGQGYDIIRVKEYTQSNFRCLLVQAAAMLEDNREVGGQLYFFVYNGHSWCDVSEATEVGTSVVWHKKAEGWVPFWRRTEFCG